MAAAHPDYPASTNISSPVQAKSRRQVPHRNKSTPPDEQGYDTDDGFIVPDDEMEETLEESEDGFEPLREAGKPRSLAKRRLGPPITIDEKMKGLNAIHQAVIDDFLHHAKRESKKVSWWQDLRVLLTWLTMLDSYPARSTRQPIHRYIIEGDGYQLSYQ